MRLGNDLQHHQTGGRGRLCKSAIPLSIFMPPMPIAAGSVREILEGGEKPAQTAARVVQAGRRGRVCCRRGPVPCAGARSAQDRLPRPELPRPRRRERGGHSQGADPVQQVRHGPDRPRRSRSSCRRSARRSITRPSWSSSSARGGRNIPAADGAGPRRRLHRRPRRLGARLAAEEGRQAVDGRQDLRHLRPDRPGAGHRRRGARPAQPAASACGSTARRCRTATPAS